MFVDIIKKQSKSIKRMDKKQMLSLDDDLVLMMTKTDLGLMITTIKVRKLLNLAQATKYAQCG